MHKLLCPIPKLVNMNMIKTQQHTKMPEYLARLILAFVISLNSQTILAENSDEVSRQAEVRGVVIAKNRAALSVDIKVKVLKIPFKVGDAFNKGNTLLVFDCEVKKAESAAAYAAFLGAKAKHNSNVEMEVHKAVGHFEVELSKAEMSQALAIWKAAKGLTKNCVIKAPFDGRVAELTVQKHELPNIERPVITIVSNKNLELHFVVSSKWLAWLSTGKPFVFHIDETGLDYPAKVERIGAEVDPVSGTIEVFGLFDGSVKNVLSGMSGTAKFSSSPPCINENCQTKK